jgi:hypothetical protein
VFLLMLVAAFFLWTTVAFTAVTMLCVGGRRRSQEQPQYRGSD